MIAKNAAPDIDRLVFAVHRNARRHAADRLPGLMQAAGLDELGAINALDDLLMAGGLTRPRAALRVRYMVETVDAFLDECVEAGSLVLHADRFIASHDLAEVLRYLHESRAAGASELWGTRGDVVEELTADAVKVLAAAGDSPLLAAYHDVPLDERRDIRLFELLTRLRYLRNDAHAAAWSAAGMTASDMVELTPIWQGSEPRGDQETLTALEGRWLISEGALTEQGRSIRQAIEDETNRLSQPAFATLGDRAGRFAEMLVSLPDEPEQA